MAITWALEDSNVNNQWLGVAYSPKLKLFAACGVVNADTTHLITTSPDGVTWTRQFTGALGAVPFNGFGCIAWSPALALFVAIANGNVPTVGTVATSPDGIVWTLNPLGTSFGFNWVSLCWSPELGIFVAGVGNGSGSDPNPTMTSPDGFTWTLQGASSTGAGYVDIAWSPKLGVFAAVAAPPDIFSQPVIATSPDGATWTQQTTALTLDQNMLGICWSDTLSIFCAVGLTGSAPFNQNAITSSNGTTWTIQTTPAPNGPASAIAPRWSKVVWATNLKLFVAVCTSQSLPEENGAMSSPDGIVWTILVTPFIESSPDEVVGWKGLAYNPDKRAFAAVSFTVNEVFAGVNENIMSGLGPAPPPPPAPGSPGAGAGPIAPYGYYAVNAYDHCLFRDFLLFNRVDPQAFACARKPLCFNVPESEWGEMLR